MDEMTITVGVAEFGTRWAQMDGWRLYDYGIGLYQVKLPDNNGRCGEGMPAEVLERLTAALRSGDNFGPPNDNA